MNSTIKSIVINVLSIIFNISLALLLNLIFYGTDMKNFVMFACGFILFSTIVINVIAQKLGFKLDIFAFELDKTSYLILNNIFIGNMISIPLSLFMVTIL